MGGRSAKEALAHRLIQNDVDFRVRTPDAFCDEMRNIFLLNLLLAAVMAAGCAAHKGQKPKSAPPLAAPQAIVTPDSSLVAKVISVNQVGRFVILNFPMEQMPRLQQPLFLYREGLKVAELKVSGPQQDDNIAADVIAGDAQVGDVVRDQ
jgi:hypothetical protein